MQYCFEPKDINRNLYEREEVFEVFFEKMTEMEQSIYKLWDVSEDKILLKNILNSITIFKSSYYDSRQKNDFECDVTLLKMGRFLCKIPYVYLMKEMRNNGYSEE